MCFYPNHSKIRIANYWLMYVIIKVIRAINISPKHVHFTLPCGYFYKGLFNMVKLREDLKDLSLNISITIIECFSKNHT